MQRPGWRQCGGRVRINVSVAHVRVYARANVLREFQAPELLATFRASTCRELLGQNLRIFIYRP